MISIRLKKAIAVENAEELAKAGSNKADVEQAAKDKDEAQAALEEAKRLREEAEAIRAKEKRA